MLIKGEKKVKTESNSKNGGTDFSLNSDTLTRIANMTSRSSDVILNQKDYDKKRQAEREKLMNQILKDGGFDDI